MGPFSDKSVDYPIYAHKLANNVKKNKKNVGILICGSGTGMNIAANKHRNIRAVPIGEAMMHCVLLDHYLMNKAQCGD